MSPFEAQVGMPEGKVRDTDLNHLLSRYTELYHKRQSPDGLGTGEGNDEVAEMMDTEEDLKNEFFRIAQIPKEHQSDEERGLYDNLVNLSKQGITTFSNLDEKYQNDKFLRKVAVNGVEVLTPEQQERFKKLMKPVEDKLK